MGAVGQDGTVVHVVRATRFAIRRRYFAAHGLGVIGVDQLAIIRIEVRQEGRGIAPEDFVNLARPLQLPVRHVERPVTEPRQVLGLLELRLAHGERCVRPPGLGLARAARIPETQQQAEHERRPRADNNHQPRQRRALGGEVRGRGLQAQPPVGIPERQRHEHPERRRRLVVTTLLIYRLVAFKDGEDVTFRIHVFEYLLEHPIEANHRQQVAIEAAAHEQRNGDENAATALRQGHEAGNDHVACGARPIERQAARPGVQVEPGARSLPRAGTPSACAQPGPPTTAPGSPECGQYIGSHPPPTRAGACRPPHPSARTCVSVPVSARLCPRSAACVRARLSPRPSGTSGARPSAQTRSTCRR